MYKYLFIILAALVAIGLAFKGQFHATSNPSQKALIVGLQSGYPPFEYKDAKGKIVGFDIDVAELIAAKLGKKLVIQDMEFEGEILSLKQKKIDLIVSGMNITPSREKEIFMVPYHGDKSLSLVFWEKVPEGVKSLQDVSTVSVGIGTIPETYISQYPKIHAKSFEGALACLMDVKYGKSDATLVETDVAEYLQKQHPEIKIMPIFLAKEEVISSFGIGINKDNKELHQKVQEVVHELKASGELEKLEKKWFKNG